MTIPRALTSGLGLVALAIAASIAGANAADAEYPPLRPLIATGDVVHGFGRVGTPEVRPLGIDDRGRVLVATAVADSTVAVAWAAGDRLEPVWRGRDDGAAASIDPTTAASSDSGAIVVALGGAPVYGYGYSTLLDLTAGTEPPPIRLAVNDTTTDGWTIAALDAVADVADNGTLLLAVRVLPSDGSATPAAALLVLDGDGARIVVADSGAMTADRRVRFPNPISVTADGVVAFGGARDDDAGIYRADAHGIFPVLTNRQATPDGKPIEQVVALAGDRNGELLLLACTPPTSPACDVYRTAGDTLVLVRSGAEIDADGNRTEAINGALNSGGDVLLDGRSVVTEPYAVGQQMLTLYAADGSRRLVAAPAYKGFLNDARQVAFGGDFDGIRLWDAAGLRPVLSAQPRLDDGARALSSGVSPTCLADDGRVGAAVRFDDDTGAWLCLDGAGVHVLERNDVVSGAPLQCAFGAEELVIARGDGIDRVADGGVTQVIAPGALLPDGARLVGVLRLATNAHGTIAALVSSDAGPRVLRITADDAVGVIPLSTADGDATPDPRDILGLSTDDSVVVAADLQPDGAASPVVLIAKDDRVGVLGRTEIGGELLSARVRGQVLVTDSSDLHGTRIVRRFDLDTGEASDFLPAGASGWNALIDFTANGDAVFASWVGAAPFDRRIAYWLIERGGPPQLLEELASDQLPSRVPVALGAGGYLLVRPTTARRLSGATELLLAGPQIAARCPRPATVTTDAPGGAGGCQTTATPHVTGWMLVLLLIVWAAGRRPWARRVRPPARRN
ncbi:MAG TPA: hypothetical protein VL049_05345 [Candidatus Dormibacteraeota bacterium]|nr:hypothetical protein [Candidatus Dormibacteraeota bacterium]